MSENDCIVARATAPGAAGVGIVRLSGSDALKIGNALMPRKRRPLTRDLANTFFHTTVHHPHSGKLIDDVIVLVFSAPNSYTGEDTVELQGHGGRVVVEQLLSAVLAAGARLAAPGEFTRRAFINGRLDLTQAEAVCDLVQAQSERAAQVARQQLDGALGREVGDYYEEAAAICAEIEYMLDFVEGELPGHFLATLAQRLSRWCVAVTKLLATRTEGQLLREGALVVLCGRPNAGKSSLLNALLRRERAIVHHTPGTTRDSLEEGFELNGVPLCLVDTAGLRASSGEVESAGITRARRLISQADLLIYLVDGSQPPDPLCATERESLPHKPTILVRSKSDLPPHNSALQEYGEHLAISVKTGQGLPELKAAILERLGVATHSETIPVALRHAEELRVALDEAQAAHRLIANEDSGELVLAAGHLRTATEALGRITGRVYSDDLLDLIFSRFCVGK